MSLEAHRAVIYGQFAGDPRDFALLVVVADFTDKSGVAFPGLDTLAKCSRMGRSTTARRLSSLIADGWIERTKGGGPSIKSALRLNMLKLLGDAAHTVPPVRQKAAHTVPPVGPIPRDNHPASRGQPSHLEQITVPLGKPSYTGTEVNRVQQPKQKAAHMKNGMDAVIATTLPAFIPPASWAMFVEHRRAMKKSLTADSALLAVRKLQRLHEQGHDVAECISESVLNGWPGLYPPKQARDGTATVASVTAKAAALADGMREIAGR